MSRKSKVRKSAAQATKEPEELYRLTDIDPEYVSLVRAGANRQKAFMVVKEDDEATGGTASSDGGDSEKKIKTDIEVGKQQNETHDAPPDDPDGRDDKKSETDKSTGSDGADGTGDSEEGGEDLTPWLNEAGDQIEELSLDVAIQHALDSQADSQADGAGDTFKGAKGEANTGLPSVKKVGEEVQEKADLAGKVAKLEVELELSRSELRKARREITALKAKNARLSKDVGQSSVMLTGEVTAKGSQPNDVDPKSPSRGAFLSGGDIAAAVTDD